MSWRLPGDCRPLQDLVRDTESVAANYCWDKVTELSPPACTGRETGTTQLRNKGIHHRFQVVSCSPDRVCESWSEPEAATRRSEI